MESIVKNTIVGVDLAKKVIQVCVYTNKKVQSIKSISIYDDCLHKSIEVHPDCKKLLRIEGVGPLNAVNLYIAIGCADLGTFNKGKDASACIGLTPIQHSSGGNAKIGTIGRYVKNSLLRSQLNEEHKARTLDLSACSRKYQRARVRYQVFSSGSEIVYSFVVSFVPI